MDVHTAIRSRYSVRRFKDRPVEEDKLQRILEAGRLAPSARNHQEWRFVVVRDPEIREKLMAASFGQRQVGEAPIVIAACAETNARVMSCGQLAYPINVSIAVDHMTLAATAEGLGTCWICRFEEAPAKQALGLPEHGGVRIVALLPLGYAEGDSPAEKKRLSLETIIKYERW